MPRATRLYQSLWLGDGGAPGDRRLAELLQRGATAPGPGLPNAARGVRWRSLRACGQRLHGGWLRRCRQARRHGRKRSVDLCRMRLILHQYLLPRIGRDIGNTAGLSLKSPRFLSSRWGPPQTHGQILPPGEVYSASTYWTESALLCNLKFGRRTPASLFGRNRA